MTIVPSARESVKRAKKEAKDTKAAHKEMRSKMTAKEKKKSDEFNKKYPVGYMSEPAKALEARRKRIQGS